MNATYAFGRNQMATGTIIDRLSFHRPFKKLFKKKTERKKKESLSLYRLRHSWIAKRIADS